jgi:formamidopyrimidine-DNA glycosylase
MPELPDLTIYIEALERFIGGKRIEQVRLVGPSLLRTVDPSLTEVHGKSILELRRMGKQIVFGLNDDLFLIMHLKVTGRFHWKKSFAGKDTLAALDFSHGTLLLTETGPKKLASLHVVRGEHGLQRFASSGIEPLEADLRSFQAALTRMNRRVKSVLIDPELFSGIGNAYSDEILHRARLSPIKQTGRLDQAEIERLYDATRTVLSEWIERLRQETGGGFPERLTAFHEDMAVHGKYKQPCPACGSPVQRIVYTGKEWNYCPTCQTGGTLLTDRALSRLLR